MARHPVRHVAQIQTEPSSVAREVVCDKIKIGIRKSMATLYKGALQCPWQCSFDSLRTTAARQRWKQYNALQITLNDWLTCWPLRRKRLPTVGAAGGESGLQNIVRSPLLVGHPAWRGGALLTGRCCSCRCESKLRACIQYRAHGQWGFC